jgi:hypothetical protein
MRKRQSFLLTILSTETGDTSFCGRLKVISSGKTSSFSCLEELYDLISLEMDEDELNRRGGSNLPCSASSDALPTS